VSWLSQYPTEREILFAPLTSLEVVGKKVEGQVLVVRVRLNVNMVSQTIEEVIAKMKQSHIQMLETMIAKQQQDLTEAEVAPLHSLRDKVESGDPLWYNSPENFEAATNKAMEAQRQIVIEGVKSKRLRMKEASQLRSAAHFAAVTNPTFALSLLNDAMETDRKSKRVSVTVSKAQVQALQSDASSNLLLVGSRTELDGNFTASNLMESLFEMPLEDIIGGVPSQEQTKLQTAMLQEHTQKPDSLVRFNAVGPHEGVLLTTKVWTAPYIEWHFVKPE
jgi:hypothetical protein